jgi:hypothetical protein
MMLLGVTMIVLGFIMASSEPLRDWKVLWGFCILIVGILCLLSTLA